MRPSRPALATGVIGVAMLWTTLAVAQDQSVRDAPAMVNGRPVPAVQGAWRSRGYGYVVRITDAGPRLFHVAGGLCYADRRPEPDPDKLFLFYRLLGQDTVAFSGEIGQTRYVFDRLADLPSACAAAQAPWTAPRIAALVGATFAELYPSFAERGIDWRARMAAAERALDDNSSDAALFDTLETMLKGVEDPHVELHAKVAGAKRDLEPGDGITIPRIRSAGDPQTAVQDWVKSYQRGVLDVVLQGNGRSAARDRILWGRVADIGYLNVISMSSFSEGLPSGDRSVLDAALDEAVASFQGARAVIVDVTYNRGGYDGIAQHIAGRFTDTRTFAYTKIGFGAQGVEPQPFHVEPSARARYTGPVYLLTSDVTLSAAEIFTLYMRSLPNVIHVGDTTRGAFSDMVEKPLPNGWTLLLSAEVYRDPDGQNYEVRGLPPRVKREIFPADDLTGGHPRAVLALMDEIRRDAIKPAP
jgi:carboxyl-terminal processing protease